MLLRASLELPVPAETAADRLTPLLLPRGLDRLSGDAYQAGMLAITRVGPFGDTAGLSKTVRVETLEPRAIGAGVRIPFRWVATGRTGHWFPTLDADLDVTAVDEQRCTLSISASYTPPLGAAGAQLDRLVLHRAARATMRSLLSGLADAMVPHRAETQETPETQDSRVTLGEIQFFPDLTPPTE